MRGRVLLPQSADLDDEVSTRHPAPEAPRKRDFLAARGLRITSTVVRSVFFGRPKPKVAIQ